ncbi:MAG: Lrp/AsnC family transcriptional regulator [Phycisphaerae bacterium]
MDSFDRRLLGLIQRRVPLVREPFAELAAGLDSTEEDVLNAVAALRSDGVIREISAIFDAVALGYEQALVAMRVPPERLDEAGLSAAKHPGVSHCYGREGDVNLWLTLAISPRSRLGLAGTAAAMARQCGAADHMLLPTLRRYKLQVRFDMEGVPSPKPTDEQSESGGSAPHPQRPAPNLSDEQLRAVRALQVDLPCRPDPFAVLAAAERIDPDMLLVHAADFLAAGWMRRYAAVLHHRAAGARSNVLVAWEVPEALADVAGARCAQQPNVSHCYLRPTGPEWPFNLYTMVHGRSEQDCRLTIEEIITTTHMARHVELWTDKEYKKRRVRLFTDAERQWEALR